MKILRALFVLALLSSCSNSTGSDDKDHTDPKSHISDQITYDIDGANGAKAIAINDNGERLIGGYWDDPLLVKTVARLIKTDRKGDTLWTKKFYDEFGTIAYEIRDIVYTNDGEYLLLCRRYLKSGTVPDLLIKINENGDSLWSKRMDYAFHSSDDLKKDVSTLIQTEDGNYLLVGNDVANFVSNDMWFAKVDKQGEIIWQKKSREGYAARAIETASGFLLVGCSRENNTKVGTVFSVSNEGEELWRVDIGKSVSAVAPASDGGYIITGLEVDSGGGTDFFTCKLSGDGALVWQKSYAQDAPYYPADMIKTDDGNYLIIGRVQVIDERDANVWIIKVDDSCEILWSETVGSETDEYVYEIKRVGSGSYIVTGSTNSLSDMWTFMVSQ